MEEFGKSRVRSVFREWANRRPRYNKKGQLKQIENPPIGNWWSHWLASGIEDNCSQWQWQWQKHPVTTSIDTTQVYCLDVRKASQDQSMLLLAIILGRISARASLNSKNSRRCNNNSTEQTQRVVRINSHDSFFCQQQPADFEILAKDKRNCYYHYHFSENTPQSSVQRKLKLKWICFFLSCRTALHCGELVTFRHTHTQKRL